MKKSDMIKKLKAASIAYYNSDEAIMSDAQFNKLRYSLEKLDPEHPFLKQIGAPLSNILNKANHEIPMGSLNNSKDAEEARVWFEKHGEPVLAMHKMDGASLELIYQDGVLIQAITRGNGEIGEDVTDNVRKFKNVHPQLSDPFTGSVRGEAMLYREEFKEFFKDKANARNAGNGCLRRKDGTGSEHMRLIAFDYLGKESFSTHKARLQFLEDVGFDVVAYRQCNTVKALKRFHQVVVDSREELPFEIDGVVARVNNEKTFHKMGERDGRPKGATAYKFEAMSGETKLLRVELTVGHTGAVIPTAKLEPVEIGGVTVTSALLNNFEEIERLGIAIGDEVRVIRAGDVIPKITGVSFRGNTSKAIKVPERCPVCNTDLVKEGAHLFCKNWDCPARQEARLETYIAKRGIMFIGDGLRKHLFTRNIVTEPQHLYTKLTEKLLAKMVIGKHTFGMKRAKKVVGEIEKSKKATLAEFFGSLSIKLLGRRQMKHIMFGSGAQTVQAVTGLSAKKLAIYRGFTMHKARIITEGIQGALPTIKALLAAGIRIIQEEKVGISSERVLEGILAGKIFVFTGKVLREDENGKRYTKGKLEELVVAKGGICPGKVDKSTTYLVIADPSKESSKTKKAKKLGVNIISQDEFFGMVK